MPPLQADSAVPPQRRLAAKTKRRIEVYVVGQGTNPAEAGHLLKPPHRRLAARQPHQLLIGLLFMSDHQIVLREEQLQVAAQHAAGRQPSQQSTPLVRIAQRAAVDEHAVLPQAAQGLIAQPHPFADPLVIKRHVLLQEHPLQVLPKRQSEVCLCLFLGVQRIVFVRLFGDQTIPPRLADQHLVHVRGDVPCQPAGQRSFLEGQQPRPGHLLQRLDQRGNRRVATLPPRHAGTAGHHHHLRECTMHIPGDKMIRTHAGAS